MPMSDRPALEFLILCGFLGSGKTTLLSQFLRGRDLHDTAVIVNEAGEVGIDAAILQANAPEDPVLMLDNGCVCCSLRSSLVDTVLRLVESPRPMGMPPLARIVLETSGISRPGAVLASLRDRDLVKWPLDFRVLCTFDASRTTAALDATMDEALAQWAAAHRIVLTKLDLVDPCKRAAARAAVRQINPLAELIDEPELEQRIAGAFGSARPDPAPVEAREILDGPAMPEALEPESLGTSLAHPRIRVFRGDPEPAMDWARFSAWVDDLAALLGERLLRFKAIVDLSDSPWPVMLQSVGTEFGAPQPAPPRRATDDALQAGPISSIIVIARDCDPDWIAEHLAGAPVRLRAWRARLRAGAARWPGGSQQI
jgi:G3E family GTPase